MIIETPPASVDVGGVLYDVDTDFGTMIEIENLIMGKEVTKEQRTFADEIIRYNPELSFDEACMNAKYHEALHLFYKGNIPQDLEKAIEKLVWFYGCGKSETKGKQGKKPLYSYRHDFDYIKKYGAVTKSMLVINEKKAVTKLTKPAVRKAFEEALKI